MDSIDRAMAYEAAEREKFERWAKANTQLKFDRDLASYFSGTTQFAWMAWIERAIETSPPQLSGRGQEDRSVDAGATEAGTPVLAADSPLSTCRGRHGEMNLPHSCGPDASIATSDPVMTAAMNTLGSMPSTIPKFVAGAAAGVPGTSNDQQEQPR